MSVSTVCIKRFKFACMTILSPETVSLIICQWFIADMQVPPVPNHPKNAKILAQNALKCKLMQPFIKKNLGRDPPESSYLSCSPPSLVLSMPLQFLVYQSLAATTEDCVPTHFNLTDRVLTSLCFFLQQIQIINVCHHNHSPC